jgi:hypothetical protein
MGRRHRLGKGMTRTVVVLCLLVFALNELSHVGARSPARTASPPIVPVVIDKIDPVPAGLPAKLTYGGRGGGPPDYAPPPEPTGIHWRNAPPPINYPRGENGTNDSSLALFTACGYRSSEAPVSTLMLPSGRKESLSGKRDEYSAGCWNYAVDWSYGMELGIYRLTLAQAEGNLEYTWGIDYPYCKVATPVSPYDSDRILLMGLADNETVTIHIYRDIGKSVPYGDDVGYVTSRAVTVQPNEH